MIIRVSGFDAAFANFGIAQAYYDTATQQLTPYRLQLVVTSGGKTKAGLRVSAVELARARHIYKQMRRNTLGMDICVAEVPSGSQSAKAGHQLGIVIGVLATHDIPLIQVTPTQVKLHSVGDRKATKDQMIDWAVSLYPDLNWPIKSNGRIIKGQAEHLADAIGVLHAAMAMGKIR